MAIFGTELSFPIPSGITASDFGDQFDAAIENDVADNFYSIDAMIEGEVMSVLVGINVPEDVEAQEFFAAALGAGIMLPLAEIGIPISSIKQVEAAAFAF
jgi:hypothetical protein